MEKCFKVIQAENGYVLHVEHRNASDTIYICNDAIEILEYVTSVLELNKHVEIEIKYKEEK